MVESRVGERDASLTRAGGERRVAPPVQQQRQRVFDGRADESAAEKRLRTEDEKTAAASIDEIARGLELRARELIAADVGEDQRVVREEARGIGREPGRQRPAAAARRLNVVGIVPLLVLSLADDGIHFEAAIGGQRALQKTVLEARRPFDEQHAAGA